MRFSYRMVREDDGYFAECIESDVAGEGSTAAEAVASLRTALEERLLRPDAVAPPSSPSSRTTIDLVHAHDDAGADADAARSGPGVATV